MTRLKSVSHYFLIFLFLTNTIIASGNVSVRNTSTKLVESLPDELWANILEFCHFRDHQTQREVCRKWNQKIHTLYLGEIEFIYKIPRKFHGVDLVRRIVNKRSWTEIVEMRLLLMIHEIGRHRRLRSIYVLMALILDNNNNSLFINRITENALAVLQSEVQGPSGELHITDILNLVEMSAGTALFYAENNQWRMIRLFSKTIRVNSISRLANTYKCFIKSRSRGIIDPENAFSLINYSNACELGSVIHQRLRSLQTSFFVIFMVLFVSFDLYNVTDVDRDSLAIGITVFSYPFKLVLSTILAYLLGLFVIDYIIGHNFIVDGLFNRICK